MAKPKKNDFGRVIDAWLSTHQSSYREHMREKQEDAPAEPELRGEAKAMRCQAVLDLHGRTKTEAEAELSAFLRESFGKGLRKVLIVHGKGHHSGGEPVLKKTVYDALRACNFAGETGIPDRAEGGSGAVWVMLRQRSR